MQCHDSRFCGRMRDAIELLNPCANTTDKLELISRWSRIIGNSATLGAAEQSADEAAVGAVWYIRGQAIKVTCDATNLNGAPIRDLALNILPGDDGWLYRTQMQ